MACLLGIQNEVQAVWLLLELRTSCILKKKCCPKFRFSILCHKNFVKWIGQTMREFNVFSTANPLGKYLSLIVKSSIYRQSSHTKVLWKTDKIVLCRSGTWTMNRPWNCKTWLIEWVGLILDGHTFWTIKCLSWTHNKRKHHYGNLPCYAYY